MFCRNCGKPVHEQAVACPACGCAPRMPQGKFCGACGGEVNPAAVACVHCGAGLTAPCAIPGFAPGQLKSRSLAGILNILAVVILPGGIGRLYLGYIGIGIAQLLLSFVCVGAIWSLIDGILILTGSVDRDANNQPLAP